MTLQASGLISLSDLKTEFAQPDGVIWLGSYYRGGGIVPSAVSANVPTSGAIDLQDFYGVSNTIPPAFTIGQVMWEDSFTGAPATGLGDQCDHTYTVPDLTSPFQCKFEWSITCTESYGFTYCQSQVNVNGVGIYDGQVGPGPTLGGSNTYYRDYAGVRGGETTFMLQGGDVIRTFVYVGTRQQNAYPPIHTALSAKMTRVA